MSLRVKAVIECGHYDFENGCCHETAETTVPVSEDDSCCHSSGKFYIEMPCSNTLPEGWTKGWYNKDRFFCPKHTGESR